MKNIKIRYTYKRKEDGQFYQKIVPIESLEGKGDKRTVDNDNPYWDIIARDLFIGLTDKNNDDIFEGDILGNTKPEICVEGNVEFIEGEFKLRAYDAFMKPMGTFTFAHYSSDFYRSPKDYEIIGNIYENKELLE
jgi:uncharacterized phage protein (TIGR01671 family)